MILGCDDLIAFVRTSGSPIPKEEFAPEVNGLCVCSGLVSILSGAPALFGASQRPYLLGSGDLLALYDC